MVAVELCAGAGGLTRGFVAAGIEVAIAVERDRYAAATYRRNFPTVDMIQEDIVAVSGETILRKLGLRKGELDVLVAGLPCRGFSESNRRTRSASNPGNLLYRQVLRLLGDIKPRWFVIENVAGIATLESGRFLADVKGEFEAEGYRIDKGILNAGEFGVPQCRRRAFLVGTCTHREFRFPDGKASGQPTVRDAIGDLPAVDNGASVGDLRYRVSWAVASEYARELRPKDLEMVSGNEVSRNCERVLERYRFIGMGENWRAIPVRLMENYKNRSLCHTGIYYRLCWDQQAKVIGNFRKNMLIHPSQDRGLSIREAARLQSFDDSHEFLGPLNHRQQQVGDAVPPRLAQVVGEAIRAGEEEAVSGVNGRSSRRASLAVDGCQPPTNAEARTKPA